jgi:ABC-type branched-subunit amino acid transport system substrate-binding protein
VWSGKTIKVGVLVPISGANKHYAEQSLAGLKAAAKMQTYLKNGDKIEFVIADTKSDVAYTRKALYDLKAQGVKAIISFLGSDETLAIGQPLRQNKIPFLVTLATNDDIPSMNEHIAQVCFDNNMQSLVAAHYIKDEKLVTHIGIIYNRANHYSYALAKEFKRYYKSIGGSIDFYTSIKDKDSVKKILKKKHLEAKVLYNTTSAATTLKILKIIKHSSWDLQVLSGDGLLSSVMALDKTNISRLDGLYVTEHYAHNVLKSKERKHLEKLLQKNGYRESSYAFLAYDSYMLLQNALDKCESYKGECITQEIRNSDVINGASGNFSMINAKARREIYIDKIHNGKLYKEIVTY